MFQKIFKFTKVRVSKLRNYGFRLEGDKYQFETHILDGQFKLFVFVAESGEVSTKVVDSESQDEYTLYLTQSAVGAFVGEVKSEIENVLLDIKDKCFERDVFKSEQAKQIIEYIRCKYGDELEFLWEKFSNNAIWRKKSNNKWYGLLVALPKHKLGIDSDEIVDIIDLRIDPAEIEKVIDEKKYFKAYHMNKKHWFTICLDESVPTETIFKWIDKSYNLA